jgi:ABC-2 type transport system ATP-binding protein
LLEVRSLSFSYRKKPIVSGLSFDALPGTVTVLAGPNGSGKSTTLSLIAGVLRPDSGSIKASGRIGYVPQGTALFEDMTVLDNLRFFASEAGADIPPRLPFGVGNLLKKRVSALSGGMKKRVSICVALVGDPQIFLFDEPVEGLDLLFRDELSLVIRNLRANGRTILYAGHETAEYADFYDRLIFIGPDGARFFEKAQLSGTSGDPDEEAARLTASYRMLLTGQYGGTAFSRAQAN